MPALPNDAFERAPLCCLIGPTAAGKTAFALEVAEAAGAEILSLDSMLVYRGMDVGTAKPSSDERSRIVHHMIDLVQPHERYDVQRYLTEACVVLDDVLRRGKRALFVGGTGFYLAALLRGLFDGPEVDPELRAALELRFDEQGPEALHAELARIDPTSAQRIHMNDRKRLVRALEVQQQTGRSLSDWQKQWGQPSARESSARLVGLQLEREALDARINARCGQMLDAGWREEATRIRAGDGLGQSAAQALGYAEVLAWADGESTRAETEERIAQRTRRFARRQDTWYRKFPIKWLSATQASVAEALNVFGW